MGAILAGIVVIALETVLVTITAVLGTLILLVVEISIGALLIDDLAILVTLGVATETVVTVDLTDVALTVDVTLFVRATEDSVDTEDEHGILELIAEVIDGVVFVDIVVAANACTVFELEDVAIATDCVLTELLLLLCC